LETNHKFWVDLETVMLNFRKILPRPTWSVFNITQNTLKINKTFSIQTKAIRNLIQSSKTFMFTSKANSKQKRMKNSGLRGKWFAEIVSRFYN